MSIYSLTQVCISLLLCLFTPFYKPASSSCCIYVQLLLNCIPRPSFSVNSYKGCILTLLADIAYIHQSWGLMSQLRCHDNHLFSEFTPVIMQSRGHLPPQFTAVIKESYIETITSLRLVIQPSNHRDQRLCFPSVYCCNCVIVLTVCWMRHIAIIICCYSHAVITTICWLCLLP